jgi:hypothetical protein
MKEYVVGYPNTHPAKNPAKMSRQVIIKNTLYLQWILFNISVKGETITETTDPATAVSNLHDEARLVIHMMLRRFNLDSMSTL